MNPSPRGRQKLNGGNTDIRIAYIGGGSRQWATLLMTDLALSSCLCGEILLYDIDHQSALQNEELGRAVFSHPDAKSAFKVEAVTSLKSALKGADVVVISIEPGPTELRFADLEIPAKYGILQTVGDTTGPGGILRALRSGPIFGEFARAIMEHCPKAWVINYTNPLAICVAALYAEAPEIKAFGCCHEVFGTQGMLARRIEKWFNVEKPARHEVKLDIAGVNHFTWATKATWQGIDLLPRLREDIKEEDFFGSRVKEARAAKRAEKWFAGAGTSLVSMDFLRRFDALGAAGDRHLVEFVHWYLTSEENLHRWGVILTPYSARLKRSPRTTPDSLAGKALAPSGEEGVQQIEALLGLNDLTTNINLPNRGQLAGYPCNAIVETYAELRHDTITPLIAGALPPGAAALVRGAVDRQQLLLDAIVQKNKHLAFQALLEDPLVRIPTDQAWQMFSEMTEATSGMLPGWK